MLTGWETFEIATLLAYTSRVIVILLGSLPLADWKALGSTMSFQVPEDWRGLLRSHPQEARQVLRALLTSRIVFEPGEDASGRFFRFRASGSLSQALTGLACTMKVVTPAGFEPAISTLKGSRPWPG